VAVILKKQIKHLKRGMIAIKKITIFFILIVSIIILAPFSYVQFKKHQASDRVWQYLTEEKGYEENDIKGLKSEWSFIGIPTYHVEVIFKNEPNIVYYYFAHREDAKGQFEYYDLNGKNVPIENLKNYDPNS